MKSVLDAGQVNNCNVLCGAEGDLSVGPKLLVGLGWFLGSGGVDQDQGMLGLGSRSIILCTFWPTKITLWPSQSGTIIVATDQSSTVFNSRTSISKEQETLKLAYFHDRLLHNGTNDQGKKDYYTMQCLDRPLLTLVTNHPRHLSPAINTRHPNLQARQGRGPLRCPVRRSNRQPELRSQSLLSSFMDRNGTFLPRPHQCAPLSSHA